MTIIISDGKSMVCDSLVVGNFKFIISKPKVRRVSNTFYGFAGELAGIEKVVKWLESNSAEQPAPVLTLPNEMSISILGLRDTGDLFWMENHLVETPVDPPFAIGSGSSYAMGALRAGASIREAAQIAIDLDESCGGEILEFKFE